MARNRKLTENVLFIWSWKYQKDSMALFSFCLPQASDCGAEVFFSGLTLSWWA
jgi:hypothetical protein